MHKLQQQNIGADLPGAERSSRQNQRRLQ